MPPIKNGKNSNAIDPFLNAKINSRYAYSSEPPRIAKNAHIAITHLYVLINEEENQSFLEIKSTIIPTQPK